MDVRCLNDFRYLLISNERTSFRYRCGDGWNRRLSRHNRYGQPAFPAANTHHFRLLHPCGLSWSEQPSGQRPRMFVQRGPNGVYRADDNGRLCGVPAQQCRPECQQVAGCACACESAFLYCCFCGGLSRTVLLGLTGWGFQPRSFHHFNVGRLTGRT